MKGDGKQREKEKTESVFHRDSQNRCPNLSMDLSPDFVYESNWQAWDNIHCFMEYRHISSKLDSKAYISYKSTIWEYQSCHYVE
jgi:hypothetical protein